MKELPLADVYRLIEPGPVVLLSTRSGGGRANVMTMSWHMMVEVAPPRIACIVSSGDLSFFTLRKTKECVIAIPAVELTEKVVKVGNCSGRDTDKFATTWLTPLRAERVSAPLIAECFANLECRVVDTRLVNRYNLFVLEVLKAWIDPAQPKPKTIHHIGNGGFIVDGEVIHFESRMP
ncbi:MULTISPECIES: flavin reductase family protein [unclassified Mesorhizobium]|uniref:flavin reductase family protein n=1 Tax=unclassified Mesorhizobium TaxID=325217 RepID=UPI000FC9B054|nr:MULTISPECIES: flavin reductase family protein [unclassified Mesorhizobium]RUW37148.1 flavin reductase family protein [Mesorhizobium sp. M1E.F.Ca.ET.041.01.1.1]RWB61414.1 MAG: flavin reductase family protein [Mesorhizobium sp.]RWD90337.1 MAG: flavin reductase family protein [Mesorhizobium sp.]RWD95558.1 MAG: flavin reductase family protein [Mesorhizobium sp.]TIU29306.1 MAG: flavin reductase family protein [Mesorhizobium sp.]